MRATRARRCDLREILWAFHGDDLLRVCTEDRRERLHSPAILPRSVTGRRLERHTAGKGARYTRSRLPVRLIYKERAENQGAALRREAMLKRLTRAEKLALVATARRGRLRSTGEDQ